MKITDIMIGDWVDVRNSADKNTPHIERITPAHLLRDEPCLGIPITPEILEKNGFMEYRYRQGDWFFVIENKENETLAIVSYATSHRLEIESWDDLIGSFERGGIKYIHQLQQAMRLCGINKEIIVEE